MLKKYLLFSATALMLLFLGLPQMKHLNLGPKAVIAAEDHNPHQTSHKPDTHSTQAGHNSHKTSGHGEEHVQEGHQGGSVHHAPEARLLSPDVDWRGWLPLILTFFPLVTAFLIPVFNSSQRIRSIISVGTTAISFLIIIAMFEPVVTGLNLHGHFYKGIYFTLPFFQGFDASFKVDPAALLVAGVTVFLWILSTVHALSYMKIEEKRTRYEFFVLSSLAMNMGVLMAGDFLTLFFFFEGMVIFPYALIAHKEDKGALRGANMYLRLGCATSLSLLAGMVLLQQYTGSISIQTMGPEIDAMVPGSAKYIIATLLIIGFGGKAGIFFEHAWLPNAHPVAPTPASCLLSGAMIKAGAYGIFRVANMLFVPHSWDATLQWLTARHIGYAIIWVGIVTMFFGVLNALISGNSKRMLAYHSVSQMGYIVMGMGCAAYLGADGAMGLAGSMYHIVNHALFKASLFLTVGAVYYRTHELDMYNLGGLWRNMPFTCVAMFIAACGIAGIPGFNGFASKTLLHHSILEAYEHSAHYAANGMPDIKLRIAEIIFMVTAGGTFASNMKLWVFDFLGKRPAKYEDIQPAPTSMKVALGMVSVSILFIGLFPNWMLEQIIGPALAYFNFNPASHPYHIIYNTHVIEGIKSTIPILYNPVNGAFLSDSTVVHNLLGGGDAVIFGGTIFILGLRMGWFHSAVPDYLTVVYYYRSIYHTFKRSCQVVFAKLDDLYAKLWEKIIFGRSISAVLVKASVGPELWDTISSLEGKFSQAVDKVIYSQSMRAVVERARKEEGVWEGFNLLDSQYSELIDKLIFSESVKSAVKEEEDILSTAERQVWQELKQLDEKYGEAFDKAIFGQGIKALINEGDGQTKEIWREIKAMEEKYGEAFDKMIISKSVEKILKQKATPGTSSGSRWWTRFSEFDKLEYNSKLDQLLFGNVDPNAKPEENWFDRFCSSLSSIHSGDISRYISWIIVFLVIVVVTLVGKLYITSLLGFILLISIILFLVIAAVFISH